MTDGVEMTEGGNSLEELRVQFARAFVVFIWANVPVVLGAAIIYEGVPPLIAGLFAAGLAGATTFAWLRAGSGVLTRLVSSVSMAAMVCLLVFSLSTGSLSSAGSFQLDGHMYFFAALAMIAGWVDWRALAAYTAVVAVHHLAFNFLLPYAVFPEGTSFLRVVMHAVILVVQFAVLVWLVDRLGKAFASSQMTSTAAEVARAETDALLKTEEQRGRDERVKQDRIAERIVTFRGEVQTMLAGIGGAAELMRSTADVLSGVADSTQLRASDTAAISEQASSNVQTVASAAEELSASISEIARQVEQTTQIVNKATQGARASNQKVAGLADGANKIGEVIGLIQDIAEQTNLLALNATIEAARAGEMGKGFAVVAAEVKELATQTSKATEEIGAQVAAIQASTSDAVDAIGAITETMDEVNKYTAAIAAAVEQQGAATSDISRNVAEAADGTGQVAANVSGLQAAVGETTESAANVQTAASDVSKQAQALNTAVEAFLKDVAA
ncbi:methyl-accepting chemotaxis protein [Breoghania sp. L-A4]|uniref:methyl-accepting chemotaxis protein n=1 Tax=Breoghania sp. L-A4 TaxID=2304600 RepID=UPI000E35ADA0|nr:methyl-accepting chemotaxis protein [Breoghania sp. L-A4]AXS39176.1 chemotaxis protein [Breoghania sp. L-A4]